MRLSLAFLTVEDIEFNVLNLENKRMAIVNDT